jgi:AbrB family looped-hinge helix DNA binding protein
MALMRVRRAAQLTLPAEIRRALNVKEGDFLEAQIVEGGVLLKPVSVVERQRVWERMQDVTARVEDLQPDPNESNQAAEEAIAEEVERMRHPHRHG